MSRSVEDVDELQRLGPELIPDEFTVEDVVGFDDDTEITQDSSTDAEIISWARGEEEEVDDEEEVVEIDAEVTCPTSEELHAAVDMIRHYSLFSPNEEQELRKMSDTLEEIVNRNQEKSKKTKEHN